MCPSPPPIPRRNFIYFPPTYIIGTTQPQPVPAHKTKKRENKESSSFPSPRSANAKVRARTCARPYHRIYKKYIYMRVPLASSPRPPRTRKLATCSVKLVALSLRDDAPHRLANPGPCRIRTQPSERSRHY